MSTVANVLSWLARLLFLSGFDAFLEFPISVFQLLFSLKNPSPVVYKYKRPSLAFCRHRDLVFSLHRQKDAHFYLECAKIDGRGRWACLQGCVAKFEAGTNVEKIWMTSINCSRVKSKYLSGFKSDLGDLENLALLFVKVSRDCKLLLVDLHSGKCLGHGPNQRLDHVGHVFTHCFQQGKAVFEDLESANLETIPDICAFVANQLRVS